MCATFQFKKQVFKPGKNVLATSPSGIIQHVWAGFARVEILDWWQRKGGVLLDIYAERFAERSENTGKLIWDEIPSRFVIRGILDHQTGAPLIKIVTRSSTPEEIHRFQHPRMPVLDEALYPRVEIPESPNSPELF